MTRNILGNILKLLSKILHRAGKVIFLTSRIVLVSVSAMNSKLLKVALLVVFGVGLTECNYYNHWERHKKQHNLLFNPSEELSRYQIFSDNLKYINDFNSRDSSSKVKLNKFSHMVIYFKKSLTLVFLISSRKKVRYSKRNEANRKKCTNSNNRCPTITRGIMK